MGKKLKSAYSSPEQKPFCLRICRISPPNFMGKENLFVNIFQSCPRVGWARGSGRVGSGHDFAGFLVGRVNTLDILFFN